MRYYTKEWYSMMMRLGTIEAYEPIIDKEYSDEEIAQLYEDCLDKYVSEEKESYDEPPYPDDFDDEDEEMDLEDFLIGEIDGDEAELRHPSSFEELQEYRRRELEMEWEEYNNRPPFDEKEAAEEFEEMYRDNLEEPDEDLPQWVRESVDPRLLALNLLPENVYKKLAAEEEEIEKRFDELDAAADEAFEYYEETVPEGYESILEDLDDLDGAYVTKIISIGGDMEFMLLGWDDDGEEATYALIFEDPEVIEDEGLDITTETDEDGDMISDCDLLYHEVYFESDRPEVHMMFDNYEKGLKYITLSCSDIQIEQRRN